MRSVHFLARLDRRLSGAPLSGWRNIMNAQKMREPLTEEERAKFERYAGEIFSRMGLDLNSPGGRDTPRRWVGALWDMTEGYDGDPKMSTLFPVECPVCPRRREDSHCRGADSIHWIM